MGEGSVCQQVILHFDEVVSWFMVNQCFEFLRHQFFDVSRDREEFLDGSNSDMALF